MNTNGKTIFYVNYFKSKRMTVSAKSRNFIWWLNDYSTDRLLETLSADLSSAKAALDAKLGESAHYASKQKFSSDIQATERCSKFFFRPHQVLYKSPIPVD